MNIFKQIIKRMSSMTDTAWFILHGALMISAAMLACSLLLFIFALPLSPDTYTIYGFAYKFYTSPAAVLLVGILASVIAEDIIIQRGQ